MPLRGKPKRHAPVRTQDDVVRAALTDDEHEPRPQFARAGQSWGVAPRQIGRSKLYKGELRHLRVAGIGSGKASRDRAGRKPLHVAWPEQLVRCLGDLRHRRVRDIGEDHVGRTLETTGARSGRGLAEGFFKVRDRTSSA